MRSVDSDTSEVDWPDDNFWKNSSFFIASNRFWSRTCAYRGTVWVELCPSNWATVIEETPAAVILEAAPRASKKS